MNAKSGEGLLEGEEKGERKKRKRADGMTRGEETKNRNSYATETNSPRAA